jgi:hypothetical protein
VVAPDSLFQVNPLSLHVGGTLCLPDNIENTNIARADSQTTLGSLSGSMNSAMHIADKEIIRGTDEG